MATFDPGEPRTLPELTGTLTRLVTTGVSFLALMSDAAFFAPQGQAWSPAEHVRHLRKSSAPLVTAFKLPRFMLRLRFGSRRAPSRSFAEVRTVYLAKIKEGFQAGSYAPSAEAPPSNPTDRRNEIVNAWTGVTVELTNAIGSWSEPELDRHQLPHPAIGNLSVREMLAFTVYHTAHHLMRIEERAAGRA